MVPQELTRLLSQGNWGKGFFVVFRPGWEALIYEKQPMAMAAHILSVHSIYDMKYLKESIDYENLW